MKFGEIPVSDAENAILAHSLRAGGNVIKKGKRLSKNDIETLRAHGISTVVAAQFAHGDVDENRAAEAIGETLLGGGVFVDSIKNGRCNLHARVRGLVRLDAVAVETLNRIDESVTLATVSPYALVERGDIVATLKILPFAIPQSVVDSCVAAANGYAPMIQIAPLASRRAGLILTRLSGTAESQLAKAATVQRARMAYLGGEIAREIRCAHTVENVESAIVELANAKLDPILVLGASAVQDRRDIVPAAIERCGGTIVHFGMPVDPGNLLLLARRGETTVLGVPGCARSPKPSGFDWVLQRVVAGLRVTGDDIARMGAGGLIREVRGRPGDEDMDRYLPSVAAVVLAAGRSQRMGEANKLLSDVGGKPMIAHVVDILLATTARPLVVVTGHERERVQSALSGRSVHFVHNPRFADGLSTSLQAGIDAVDTLAADARGIDGAIIALGDMPWVKTEHIDALIEAFTAGLGAPICVPIHNRKRGNPILWPNRYFPEMRKLSGDAGARELIDIHGDAVTLVPVDDPGIHVDIDTPAELDRLRKTD